MVICQGLAPMMAARARHPDQHKLSIGVRTMIFNHEFLMGHDGSIDTNKKGGLSNRAALWE